ncbi:MAG: hypothetical protein WA210_19640, partial [Burkholderiaceae bacterium]
MSYILDALRRADSERERGAVPGIHAQPVPLRSDEQFAAPSTPPWVWILSACGALLVGALFWALIRAEAPATPG